MLHSINITGNLSKIPHETKVGGTLLRKHGRTGKMISNNTCARLARLGVGSMAGLPNALLVIDDVHVEQSLFTYRSGVCTHTIHPAAVRVIHPAQHVHSPGYVDVLLDSSSET